MDERLATPPILLDLFKNNFLCT